MTTASADLKRRAISVMLPEYIIQWADDLADAASASRSEVIAQQLMKNWPRTAADGGIIITPGKPRRRGRRPAPPVEVSHEPMFIPLRKSSLVGTAACLCGWRSSSPRPVSRAAALRNAGLHVRKVTQA